jgi:hydrogenase nickel incorporation protein HypB
VDLLPHLPDVSLDRIVASLREVMPEPNYIAVSARTGEGVERWITWLQEQEAARPAANPDGHAHHHGHSHV